MQTPTCCMKQDTVNVRFLLSCHQRAAVLWQCGALQLTANHKCHQLCLPRTCHWRPARSARAVASRCVSSCSSSSLWHLASSRSCASNPLARLAVARTLPTAWHRLTLSEGTAVSRGAAASRAAPSGSTPRYSQDVWRVVFRAWL
jgi:hypothetical protein